MFTLELSSHVSEIPNVVYTILSQNLIGGSTVCQNPIQLQVDCMILEKYNEKAPLNINMALLGREQSYNPQGQFQCRPTTGLRHGCMMVFVRVVPPSFYHNY